MPLYHSPNLTELNPDARKVLLHIIRELAKRQLPELVNENGLEKAEEIIVGFIKTDRIRLCCDKEKCLYWLEKKEAI